MTNSSHSRRSVVRSPHFSASAGASRRLAGERVSQVKAHPRILAELILHPVVSHRLPVAAPHTYSRSPLDVCDAA